MKINKYVAPLVLALTLGGASSAIADEAKSKNQFEIGYTYGFARELKDGVSMKLSHENPDHVVLGVSLSHFFESPMHELGTPENQNGNAMLSLIEVGYRADLGQELSIKPYIGTGMIKISTEQGGTKVNGAFQPGLSVEKTISKDVYLTSDNKVLMDNYRAVFSTGIALGLRF